MYWFLAHPSSGDLTPLHSTLPCHSIEPCHLYYVDAIMPGLPYFGQPTCAKLLGTTSRHSVNSVSGRHLGRRRQTVRSSNFWQSQLGRSFPRRLCTIQQQSQRICKPGHFEKMWKAERTQFFIFNSFRKLKGLFLGLFLSNHSPRTTWTSFGFGSSTKKSFRYSEHVTKRGQRRWQWFFKVNLKKKIFWKI